MDVLNVAHDKRYLSLDPVSQREVPPKPAVRLLSKRKVRKSVVNLCLVLYKFCRQFIGVHVIIKFKRQDSVRH